MTDVSVLVAQQSAVVAVDGTPHRVKRGRTTAHAGAAIVKQHPDLWGPLTVDYPAPTRSKKSTAK